MFWVMTALTLFATARTAMARWPRLGVAASMASRVANLYRQASRRAWSERRNSSNGTGLYWLQIPPGLRKSAIPDSVLIPAPVKAATRPASAIIRPSASISFVMTPIIMINTCFSNCC